MTPGYGVNIDLLPDGASCEDSIRPAFTCLACSRRVPGQSSSPSCALCGQSGGALKPTERDKGEWAHIICVVFIPECWIDDNTRPNTVVSRHFRTGRGSKDEAGGVGSPAHEWLRLMFLLQLRLSVWFRLHSRLSQVESMRNLQEASGLLRAMQLDRSQQQDQQEQRLRRRSFSRILRESCRSTGLPRQAQGSGFR